MYKRFHHNKIGLFIGTRKKNGNKMQRNIKQLLLSMKFNFFKATSYESSIEYLISKEILKTSKRKKKNVKGMVVEIYPETRQKPKINKKA